MGGYFLFIAVIAVIGVGLGLAARRWWFIGIACIPSFLWLWRWLATWGEPEGDGRTGADLFLLGFVSVGLPLIAGAALGVWLGRWVFRRPAPEPSGPTD